MQSARISLHHIASLTQCSCVPSTSMIGWRLSRDTKGKDPDPSIPERPCHSPSGVIWMSSGDITKFNINSSSNVRYVSHTFWITAVHMMFKQLYFVTMFTCSYDFICYSLWCSNIAQLSELGAVRLTIQSMLSPHQSLRHERSIFFFVQVNSSLRNPWAPTPCSICARLLDRFHLAM